MVKGAMCCSVGSRGGLLIRVGAEAQERMLCDSHVLPMEMAGRTVSGFVRVMPEGYRTEAAFRKMDSAWRRFCRNAECRADAAHEIATRRAKTADA